MNATAAATVIRQAHRTKGDDCTVRTCRGARDVTRGRRVQREVETDIATAPCANDLHDTARFGREGSVVYDVFAGDHAILRLAREHGLPTIVSTQNAYNLINRLFDTGGLAEVCYRERVSLLAYSPLAFGHLTGKYLADAKAEGRITAFPGFGQRYEKVNVPVALAAYRDLAAAHGMSPTQLALAFCYNRWGVTSTIIGATSMAQLEENLAAWEGRPGVPLTGRPAPARTARGRNN